MRNIHKKSLAMLVVVILCLTSVYPNGKVAYASNLNKYLVLVQQKNGSWKEYTNLIEVSSSGNLMIKAKPLSKALGFTYKKNSNGTFTIKRSSSRYNTYTKNITKFTYTKGAVTLIKSASNLVYTNKTSKYNVCQIGTLNTLVNYKYFNNTKTKDDTSYSGVICYSKYKEIPTSTPTSNPEPTKKPTPTPKPEPSAISIKGVIFPVRDNFLSIENALSDWGGAMINWYLLEEAVDGKVIRTSDLSVGSNRIEYSHMGAISDGVSLAKARNGYKLSISVKLQGSVIADQYTEIVKAMVATISSKPSFVYTAIFESFTSEVTHGINEIRYVTIGDCKVKVKIKDGEVIYYIKKA